MKQHNQGRSVNASQNQQVIYLKSTTTDPVFFRKEDIKPGTRLVYCGRHDPGSYWVVERIMHYKLRNGQWQGKRTEQVETLMDEVWLKRKGKRDYMQLNFQYISYSAIWRLA